jgi:hypothetical protein
MNNRSAYPGIAGLLPAALYIFRTALLGLTLLVLAQAAALEGPKAATIGKPMFILNLASYNQLRENFFYLARLAGQDESAALFDQLIEAQTSGREGIDRKKPAGAYGWIGPRGDDSSVVLLVPVTDPNDVLDLLENFDIRAKRGGDGVYRANVEKVPDPVYFRFANGYAYVTTRDKRVLDEDKLLAPETVLSASQGCAGDGVVGQKSGKLLDDPARGYPGDQFCRDFGDSVFSLIVNVDAIPPEFKDLFLAEFDLGLAEAKKRDVPRIETELQRKIRLATIDEMATAIKTMIYQGGETSLRLDLDRKAGDIALTVNVEGKAGSPMAAAFRDLGQTTSVTAGLLRGDAAMSGMLNFRLPERLREIFGTILDEGERQALANAGDQNERAAASMAFEAIMPTFKAAELDWSFSLLGPDSDGLYTLVGGFKVQDGARLERLFRERASKDPTAKVRLDIEKAGAIGIHRAVLKLDDDSRRVFGDNPLYYLAFRDDVILIAAGARGLGAIREALTAAPATGKVLDLQFAVSRLAPLAKDRVAQEIARSVFGDDRDADRLRLTLEGGNALTLRLSMTAKLIQYTSRLGQAVR